MSGSILGAEMGLYLVMTLVVRGFDVYVYEHWQGKVFWWIVQ